MKVSVLLEVKVQVWECADGSEMFELEARPVAGLVPLECAVSQLGESFGSRLSWYTAGRIFQEGAYGVYLYFTCGSRRSNVKRQPNQPVGWSLNPLSLKRCLA